MKTILEVIHTIRLDSNEDYESFVESIERMESLVEKILEKYEEARDCDPLLCFLAWWIEDRDRMINLMKIMYAMYKNDVKIPSNELVRILHKKVFGGLTSPETITRCRRKIQNEEGRFRPSRVVSEERGRREEMWKKYSIYGSR